MLRLSSLAIASLLVTTAVGCSSASQSDDAESTDQDFSSREAVQLDFELDGELVTDSTFNAKAKIQDQFLYTIGHLNGDRSVGRLDKLTLTNVQTATQADGTVKVTYHAKLPVAWGKKNAVPSSYSFTLPKNVSFSGLESFTTKYKESCVDFSAHDVDSGSMWYYYRPRKSGCTLDAGDVLDFTASVTTSTQNTSGKYPEYHKVWEDNQLRVVAIFGKNEEGATTSDAGISAFNSFVRSMRTTLASYNPTTEPANLATDPGAATPDVTFNAQIGNGKSVSITALLVDKVSTAPQSFYTRYNGLSTNADLIMYNGHAGLGQNVRALANQGTFVAGKYLLLFMNGCDTFAYVDGSLAQKRRSLNPDDNADGTKYLDIVTNGMPSYFHSNATASTALIKGLLSISQPQTFEQIFSSIDQQQVVLVTGEEDNAFTPGMPIGGGGGGGGGTGYTRDESGSVTRAQEVSYETPELPAGRYSITMAHDPASPGGDADLYVKAGSAPTSTSYDCRPYANGSAEECLVTLATPAKIYAKVVGYANQASAFKLAWRTLAAPQPGSWTGMNESGTVAKNEEKRYETASLPAGRYTFTLSGDGDADLYVKKGSAPSTTSYDCRPYIGGSSETCTIELTAPSAIHVMVRGYAASSTFQLAGRQ
jgi:hypothetical protein